MRRLDHEPLASERAEMVRRLLKQGYRGQDLPFIRAGRTRRQMMADLVAMQRAAPRQQT